MLSHSLTINNKKQANFILVKKSIIDSYRKGVISKKALCFYIAALQIKSITLLHRSDFYRKGINRKNSITILESLESIGAIKIVNKKHMIFTVLGTIKKGDRCIEIKKDFIKTYNKGVLSINDFTALILLSSILKKSITLYDIKAPALGLSTLRKTLRRLSAMGYLETSKAYNNYLKISKGAIFSCL